MTPVRFFQTYSKPEDTVTNNVLLFLKYLNHYSAIKFQDLLNQIFEENDVLPVGPTFSQQETSITSRFDGSITQEPWSLYIETKLGQNNHEDQLKRHIDSIKSKNKPAKKILIALSTTEMDVNIHDKIKKYCASICQFKSITFESLLETINDIVKDYETSIKEVLDDFERYLIHQGLLNHTKDLPYVPCGVSLEMNTKHRVYSEPASRSLINTKFIGLYKQKAIRFVGEVEARYVRQPNGTSYEIICKAGNKKESHEKTIQSWVNDMPSIGYRSDEAIRFYIFKELRETNVPKKSPGGIRKIRYLRLGIVINKDTTIDELLGHLKSTVIDPGR